MKDPIKVAITYYFQRILEAFELVSRSTELVNC